MKIKYSVRIIFRCLNIIVRLLFAINYCFPQEFEYLGLQGKQITSIVIDPLNPSTIYAGSGSNFSAGTVGGIFKSTNGGTSWDTLIQGITVRQIVINHSHPNILMATLGINGLTQAGIIKTTDAGNSWVHSDSGITITFERGPGPIVIDPIHPDTLYSGTGGIGGGYFYRSTNGGLFWNVFQDTSNIFGQNSIVSIAIRPDSVNHIYAGTDWVGSLLESFDYGNSWSKVNLGLTSGILYSIEIGQDPSHIFVGSVWTNDFPVGIFKSIDGGSHWSNPKAGLPDTSNIKLIEVTNINSSEVVICISSNMIYRSINNSEWSKLTPDSLFVTTSKIENNKIFVGANGIFLLNGLTSVKSNAVGHWKFNLKNNFPNPFNPATTINYEIPYATSINITVYDILGRQLQTVVNGKQSAGLHSVVFDATGFSSGVYFYQLRADEYVETKRMVVIK